MTAATLTRVRRATLTRVRLWSPEAVELDADDLAYGDRLGRERHRHFGNGGPGFDPRSVGLDPLANDVESARAEVAVARYCRRPLPNAPQGHDLPDVEPDIDVRSTRWPHGHLIHRPRDNAAFRVVLVIVSGSATSPTFTLAGWLVGGQARRPEWRVGDRWQVPQEALCLALDELVAPEPYAACEECGNDDPTEGSRYCLDCLERLDP